MKSFWQWLTGFLNGVTGKITALLVLMSLLLLAPVGFQTYTAFDRARNYRDVIDNITYANRLNTDVNVNIEPLVWNIVAGKTSFEESGVMPLVADIRKRMDTIRGNTRSADNRGVMDIAMRALGTLVNYLLRLKRQLEERFPVAENELLLEEIRVCIAGIDDLLRQFSSLQVAEVALLNDDMYRQSYQGFIVNILLILATIAASAFAIQYIIRGSVEEQKLRQKLEYRVLQEQITPHFLYNTLDAIIWAAEGGDDEAVITLVTALSSFFRTSLSQGVDFVPVSGEIEHVKSYLAIQQMRYSDILSYEIDVDEDLRDKTILKLLLQPLVENSLYHGVKNTRGRGKITVSIKRDGGRMRFSVADDGIGMSPEKLAELRENLKSGSGGKGYGLFNVNRRLKLYYGLKEDIGITSEYGRGTVVSFALDIT